MVNYIYVDRSGHKRARAVRNRKEYLALRETEVNRKNFQRAREGDKGAKMRLKQFNYNDLLPDGVLKGCCHAASTFAHDIDCGREDECREMARRLLEQKAEIGLLELSVSPNWGLHAVCRRVPGRTILENQVRLATLTQTQMDTSAHDAQRVMFTGPASPDVLLYLDDAIFEEAMSAQEAAEEFQRLREREKRGEEEVPEGAKRANKHFRPWEAAAAGNRESASGHGVPTAVSEEKGEGAPLLFKGIPYASIIDEWWRRTGGEPVEGERNVRLYQLAANLRAVCDNSVELLLRVVPRLGLTEQEVRGIVESACKETPKGVSKMMREAIQAAGSADKQGQDTAPRPDGEVMAQSLALWGAQIASLFSSYPLLEDICKGLKPSQYPAAVYVAGSLMMTLMTRCTYRFYARPEERRRLNCSTLIIGDPASGKSFATRLYEQLASPIEEADKAGMDAINAYRELIKSLGANKDKPKKPKVVVRVHPARTSNAQFIQDMVNAREVVDGEEMQLHLLTFDTELDNTLSVQRGGSWIDKQSLQLKAFHNEMDGQAYSNADSVLQQFRVVWNYIYTGTPLALRKMVNSSNFGSGLATRLTCIPLPSTNFEMMDREEHSDPESDARLRLWAEKLDRTKGELPLQRIVDELYDWTARRMADARDNDSRADEMLLKRCAYHGLNFSAPFIVMRHWGAMREEGSYYCGEFETDDVDWQLAELLANIQYACQRHFFGRMAEEYFKEQEQEASVNARRSQKTLEAFRRLPEEFTAEDVARCFRLSAHSARNRIVRLQRDHLVVKSGEFKDGGTTKARYKKTGTVML